MVFRILATLLFVWFGFVPPSLADPLRTGSAGTLAPEFTLPSTDGSLVDLKSFNGKKVILEWFNPGCPFVKKHYNSGHMQQLQREAVQKGFVWLTIDSTDNAHPNFKSAAELRSILSEWGFMGTAALLDVDGAVGKLYGAKTTPHMFVIDDTRAIVYSGAIDDAPDTSSDPAAARNYVQEVREELLSKNLVSVSETEPYGCSVKYSS